MVIVPAEADPPTKPSTDQVTPPAPAVNCCVKANVNTDWRGVTEKPVPVPDRAMVCGLPEALSVIATDELLEPVVEGVNVTLIVHVPLVARPLPQVLVWAKSPVFPPEMAIEVMERGAVPMFVKVTGCGLLVTPVG